jgi:hypothetical protein
MPDKRIDELPDVSTLGQDSTLRLMLFGNYLTGKLYKGVFVIEDNWKMLLSAGWGGGALTAGETIYGQFTGAAIKQADETLRLYKWSEDFQAKNLYFGCSGTQPASGDLIITIRKNQADTPLIITVPAGSSTGDYSNTADILNVVAGDYLSVQYHNAASSNSVIPLSIGLTLIKTA